MRKIVLPSVLASVLALALCGLTACTSLNAGMSAANSYTAAQLSAQRSNLEGVNDNAAKVWVASGCAIPYGELVRNGSGNNALARAVIALCGAPGGMAVVEVNDSGVNKILAADGFAKTANANAAFAQ